jgi:ABC-type dipeptide/oligopeptide/nickel transport system permease subunit
MIGTFSLRARGIRYCCFSAVALIALAVWFPVTMLTASGVSNTRASYLDVARTLGAGRAYLIFHLALSPPEIVAARNSSAYGAKSLSCFTLPASNR